MAEEVKIEEMFAVGNTEQPLCQTEVGGRADREELRDSLHDTEDDGLEERQGVSIL